MYVVKQSFKHGKNSQGRPNFTKVGQPFNGENAKDLLARGLIEEQKVVDEKKADDLLKKIAALEGEVQVLRKQLTEARAPEDEKKVDAKKGK